MDDRELVLSHIDGESLAVIVRPGAPKNAVRGWDEARKGLRVDIAAAPENNKANIEVIKLFSKLLKKEVSIRHGLTERKKILRIRTP